MTMRLTAILTFIFSVAVVSVAAADYESTVLEDAPLAYYRFEDPIDSEELADSTGNGNIGWEVNNVEFGQPGVAGSNAGQFFGDGSIVTELDFDPSETDWTIETWFYTTAVEEIEDPDNPGEFIEVVADQQVYVSQKDGTGVGRSNVLISANRQPGSYIGGATTDALDPFDSDPLLPEAWYHFVLAYEMDDEELFFFVNGESSDLNPQFPGANGVEPADGQWVIGSHKNQGIQFFEGLLDEIAFYDRVLSEDRVKAHYEAAQGDVSVPGDYNEDGVVDAADADAQSTAMKDPNPDLGKFDENGDGMVDIEDRLIWVHDHKGTWVGDANLDDEFNSGDFVSVFAAGFYESGTMAGWSVGDWNGDMLFDSGDFVVAFSDGGYEQGPRDAGVPAVPEPSSVVLLAIAALSLLRFRR
jgi:hypothetical protein